MTTRADLVRYTRVADRISTAAVEDLTEFFTGLDLRFPEAARDELVEFLPRLTAAYGEATTVAAAEWFEALRSEAVGGQFAAVLAETVDPDRVIRETRYAAGHLFSETPEKTLATLVGAAQKYVQYAGRETIARNAVRDPKKPLYARVPSGSRTCAWCMLLASRGWVYSSKKSAGANGHDFHAHCHCQIVVEWDRNTAHIEGFDPDAMYERYRAALSSVKAEGVVPSDATVAARMRRMFPDEVTDGIRDRG